MGYWYCLPPLSPQTECRWTESDEHHDLTFISSILLQPPTIIQHAGHSTIVFSQYGVLSLKSIVNIPHKHAHIFKKVLFLRFLLPSSFFFSSFHVFLLLLLFAISSFLSFNLGKCPVLVRPSFDSVKCLVSKQWSLFIARLITRWCNHDL